MKTNTILVGDALDRLAELPDDSVDCIVTSPPYFGLRDYGRDGQLGSETSVDDWVKHLRLVAAELARILTPTGTFWLNVGDSYSSHLSQGAPKKGLLLGPQKLAVALADDGWLIRNHAIWAKPNAMPSSVTDRLSNSHEILLLLTRGPRYYFDLDTIRVPAASMRGAQPRKKIAGYPPNSVTPAGGSVDRNRGLDRMKRHGANSHPLGKSPGDVWTIPTAAYRGAHYAVYPLGLAERCVLAGCPERVCTACGASWRRANRRHDDRLLRTGVLRPQCRCRAEPWRPGLVLDPFVGSGTTAIAAEKHRREWLGIELNADYARQADERITQSRNTTEQQR
ncbi:DNA-methyltransferase [Antrihabitans stalactiti]|uniref:Methyltransferase n=1 Tax=Antrihabitans stalactiti TaxID=2584121 RepID=A0A848KPA1_9NOCA|nr:site-specific DNA-methyltransferase [Antrihabitans stalactiti]NMN98452.1 site-specific DNA-methyltransferase [Antrihabitans stalactiti]